MMMVRYVVMVVVGLLALYLGGEWLVTGAARLASAMGVSSLVIGMTVVAFGTSLPELLVNVNASLQGSGDMAIGTILGSNIANIGLILGLTAIMSPIVVRWRVVKLEIPVMIGASILIYRLASNGTIGRLDGLILIAATLVFAVLMLWLARRDRREIEPELIEYSRDEGLLRRGTLTSEAGRLLGGLAALIFGARLLVLGASALARRAGVSEFVIGVTLLAFGTSLPELVTSVVAAARGETDIVVGNVIGSNISNLLLVLGVTTLVRPINIDARLLQIEFPVMIGFGLLLFPYALDLKLERWEGISYLAAYSVFTLVLVL